MCLRLATKILSFSVNVANAPSRVPDKSIKMNELLQDLRLGWRVLLKQPWTASSTILALTLGIGLVTTMFCFFNGTVLQGLPFPDSDRLVYTTIPSDAIREFKEQQTRFEELCSFGSIWENFKAKGAPSRRRACYISPDFLEAVGVKPVVGRGFRPGEGAPGAEPVALLGFDVWQEEFQGDPAAVGSIFWLDGKPQTVVGIMPPEFRFPINENIWVASSGTADQGNRGQGFVFGKLKPSVTPGQAQAELNTIWTRLVPPERAKAAELDPVRVGPFRDCVWGLDGPNKSRDAFLAGAMAVLATVFVLVIACTNVALLTLGRAVKRGKEFAVRGALGATRKRLIVQILVENLILAAGGAAGGLLVASWLTNWFAARTLGQNAVGKSMPSWWHYDVDWRVVLFLIVLTFLTNLLAGLGPALQATKRDANDSLKDESAGSSGLRIAGFQRFLVVSQVAMSVAIFAAAFVLIRVNEQRARMQLSFDPTSVLTARVELPPAADPGRFAKEVESGLKQAPGVDAVALSSGRLQLGWSQVLIEVEGQSYDRWQDHPRVGGRAVSEGFFKTLNLQLLQGRGFTADDRLGTPAVAVVTPAFAEQFLPHGNLLGARFRQYPDGPWLTVVGVVADVWGRARHSTDYYVSMTQQPRRDITVMLRGNGRVALIKTLRTEVARLQPDLPVFEIETLAEQWRGMDNGAKGEVRLLSICGVGSLFLSVLGIYGLIMLSVGQRTREIGIRLALGATRNRIMATIVREVAGPIATGLIVGAVLAFCLLRIVASLIEGPTDQPWPYLAAVLLLGTASLSAVAIPARYAGKMDPVKALRYE